MEAPGQRANTVRIVLQRLESLERAGVSQLPRRQARTAGPQAPLLSPRSSDPRAPLAAPPTLPTTLVPAMASPTQTAGPTGSRSAPAGSTTPATSDSPLSVLQAEVAACRRCEHLACSRTQTVFGVGPARPRLCFFGEAPGADEDRQGEPFVGRAGKLLTDIIEKGMQLPRSDVYILNVLKCRPPDNRTPTDDEIVNCREYFERQLALLQPEFICCLGATATKALLNATQSLGKMRGKWFDYQGARVIVTYHPSYLLRNPPAKKDTWEDIQLLMREMGLPIEKS